MKYRILSIDGGGVRGIIPLIFLQQLQNYLRKKVNPHVHVMDYFDAVASTSSGAIVASMLMQPRPFTVDGAIESFLRHSKDVFQRSLWRKIWTVNGLLWNMYPSAPLENALDSYLEETRLSEVSKVWIVPAFDVIQGSPVIFSSQKARKGPHYDFLMKDVVRGATAAPSYFAGKRLQPLGEGRELSVVDGGVVANNPTALAITELLAEKEIEGLNNLAVLSLGTGSPRFTFNFRWSEHWGGLMWASRSIHVQTETSGTAISREISYLMNLHENSTYLRLNPSLFASGIPALLDETANWYVDTLKDTAYAYLEEHEEVLEAFAQELL